MVKRKISVFGATGSIGSNTIDLLRQHKNDFEIVTLTAHENVDALAALAIEFNAARAVIASEKHFERLKQALAGTKIKAAAGEAKVIEAARIKVDVIVMAISGSAGLAPSYAAAGTGAHLALANKESIVCAGRLLLDHAAKNGTKILPVDSEHNAVFQILDGRDAAPLKKITLTASGGPFRTWPAEKIAQATPQDALAHPIWKMGDKISVDCASLMNKGLELIEAQYLFGLEPHQLDVLIHPQSIVHALAEFEDGSVIAQMATPDMRIAISSCLNWPQRLANHSKPLDLAKRGALEFETPDTQRFPCLALARRAMEEGGALPCCLNAANEIAVAAFLHDGLSFPSIALVIEDCLDKFAARAAPATLQDVLALNEEVRQVAASLLPYYMNINTRVSA